MMTSKYNFAIFIISHGRPQNIKTMASLVKFGYTGKFYIVVDDLDDAKEQYVDLYGDKVKIFDKRAIGETFDEGDNFPSMKSTTYARNACFDIAKNLGVEYFLVLDDDYVWFKAKFDREFKWKGHCKIKSLDIVIEKFLDFYHSCPQILSIAMAQEGEFPGGPGCWWGQAIRTKRKAMNSFFCSTNRRFDFFSKLNEDVNTYVNLGMRGHIFLTIGQVTLTQAATQSASGGMTETYLDNGTYVKSFYTLMYQPSSIEIRKMGITHRRIHHHIKWKKTVPMIVRESLKK